LVVGLGIIMFIVGFKGSQHNILPVIKGTASSARNASGNAAPAQTSPANPPPAQATPGVAGRLA
jgi:hypothetical protein